MGVDSRDAQAYAAWAGRVLPASNAPGSLPRQAGALKEWAIDRDEGWNERSPRITFRCAIFRSPSRR